MPRIRFTADFNWHVKHNVTIAYKAGREYPVTRRCAAAAVAKRAGVAVDRVDDLPPTPDFVPLKDADDASR